MRFEELKDIHTHQPGRPDALLSLPPEKAMAGYDLPYSLELHPWSLKNEELGIRNVELFVEAVRQLKNDPNLMAIGECGLDNKCDTPLPLQIEAFKVALQTAKELNLPVIIHCVGYWAEMMQCVREMQSDSCNQPLVIHGFRKGPQLAKQLLDAGFCISLGKYYNPATKAIIPQDKLYWETDVDSLRSYENDNENK